MTAPASRVVVVGGGVAGVEALLALRDLAGERVELTLLSDADDFIYRPMAVAEPFGRGHATHYSLSALAAEIGVRVVRGRLAAVDTSWRIAVTADGTPLAYDMLLVAVGTHSEPVLHGAFTWTPESDPGLLGGLLRDIEQGYSKRIAFVAPPSVAWTLPLYELALMTASQAWNMGQDDLKITLWTPEPAPLALLGSRASAATARELEQAGVQLRTGVCVLDDALEPGRLVVHRSGRPHRREQLDAERVITLPRQVAPEIPGLPRDKDGFVPVDRHGRVRRSGAVWAAGDVTDFPIKQGGLAAQQADAAAEAIAAIAGADVRPGPFQPVLRGVMLTGRGNQWKGREIDDQADAGAAAQRALWWPPPKIAGRYLTPFLTGLAGRGQIEAARAIGLPFNLDLEGPIGRSAGTKPAPTRV
jgi:sulfide:quinone oxidoreductase